MIIDLHPEFGLELVLGIPYAHWLHERGDLESVRTVNGMKPFYYFCDNVEEVYNYRTIDNAAAGLNTLPNNWIHHNAMSLFGKGYGDLDDSQKTVSNGTLDYSEWSLPNYTEYYHNDEFKFEKPFVVVSNRYNIEHGQPPIGFFDIQSLYDIFDYLTSSGYMVVYKRPKNNEFPLDTNEMNSVRAGFKDISANVEGHGMMTDYQLVQYFEDVILLDDLIKDKNTNNYNECQLKLFSNADGFVAMGGGSTLLCCLFNKPTISYFTTSIECGREDYFGDDNYYRKMCDEFYPILDHEKDIKSRGKKDYTNLIHKIREVFK
jgi:hypothetical protein